MILSADGEFKFAGLEPGSYRIDLEPPGGYSTYLVGRDVQLPNRQSCAREDYVLSPAGRITGHLVGPDGKALVEVKVEATNRRCALASDVWPLKGVGNLRWGRPLRDS